MSTHSPTDFDIDKSVIEKLSQLSRPPFPSSSLPPYLSLSLTLFLSCIFLSPTDSYFIILAVGFATYSSNRSSLSLFPFLPFLSLPLSISPSWLPFHYPSSCLCQIFFKQALPSYDTPGARGEIEYYWFCKTGRMKIRQPGPRVSPRTWLKGISCTPLSKPLFHYYRTIDDELLHQLWLCNIISFASWSLGRLHLPLIEL